MIHFKHSATFDKEIEISIGRDGDSAWIAEWTVTVEDTASKDTSVLESYLRRKSRTVVDKKEIKVSDADFETLCVAIADLDPNKLEKGTLKIGTDGTWWTVRASSWKGFILEYRFSVSTITRQDPEFEKIENVAEKMFAITGHHLDAYFKR